jgi:hypothetical protein
MLGHSAAVHRGAELRNLASLTSGLGGKHRLIPQGGSGRITPQISPELSERTA